MLRSDQAPARESLPTWTDNLVAECRDLLSGLLPLTDDETEFLGRWNDAGEIAPELIASGPVMQATIREHPGLRWKALNVRRSCGLETAPTDEAE